MNWRIDVRASVFRHLDAVGRIVISTGGMFCMLNDELEVLLRWPDNRIPAKRMRQIDDP
jgi:hypothetical protein